MILFKFFSPSERQTPCFFFLKITRRSSEGRLFRSPLGGRRSLVCFVSFRFCFVFVFVLFCFFNGMFEDLFGLVVHWSDDFHLFLYRLVGFPRPTAVEVVDYSSSKS